MGYNVRIRASRRHVGRADFLTPTRRAFAIARERSSLVEAKIPFAENEKVHTF